MSTRRDFLRKSGILAASAQLARAQPRKPNVIVMLASGLPDFALEPNLRGPRLERFAAESLQFERAYVACPETGPSQASLITGRFPFDCGVPRDGISLPADQPTISEQLKDAGYKTAIIGDWRLGGPQKTSDIEAQTGAAIGFVKQNGNNPFFLLLAWHRADATVIDDHAGRVLAATDDALLKKDAIVVFTADHGYGAGPLESAVRVPLMIRYGRRFNPGRHSGALASNVDVAPTLLTLCGLEPEKPMQGRDLTREQPQSIYSVGRLGTPEEWRMVVRGLDKLVIDRDQNVTHLYNLGADPLEMDNRAQDPALEVKRNELKALLSDWMRRTGDGFDPSGLKRRARAENQRAALFRD
jgi:arylsulfatase A-like enzyme